MEKVFTYKIRPVKPFGEDEYIETGLEGIVKVKIPDYKTRMNIVKAQQEIAEDFEKISLAAYDTCDKHIDDIALEHKDYGEITNIEELTQFEEGVAVMFDIYNQILKGWSLNPKTLKS